MNIQRWVSALLMASATSYLSACSRASAAPPVAQTDTLPVYEVVQQGATAEQIRKLSEALKLPAERLGARNGRVNLTAAEEYLSIPGLPVTDATVNRKLRASTRKEDPSTQIQIEQIDVKALRKIPVFESKAALNSAASLFAAAGLHLESAKPVVSHTVFSASYTDEAGAPVSIDQILDTRVSYQFAEKHGYPLTGPGANVGATYDGQGRVTQLQYAFRDLKEGPSVKIISEGEARNRIAKLAPANAKVDVKLVYWCPPFESAVGRMTPAEIIPWYSYTSITEVKNPRTGAISQIRSKERLIPATDDPRFVPTVRLKVSGSGGTEVSASVEVSGGRAPYTYNWVGSNPSVTTAAGASVRYTAMTRAVPAQGTRFAPNQRIPVDEIVAVNATDANGVTVTASRMIPVQAQPFVPESHGGPSHGKTASYGCESPGEPEMWTQERVGWQQGMANPGGGTQEFCWLGDSSWPGDYIRPPTPGSLPAKPWINGDIDYSNWGVNTANLVLINGDAWPDGFTAMFPGAPQSDYNSNVFLMRPGNPGGTVQIEATTYNINYDKSWGPQGPNDRLYWLLGLLCEALDKTDSSNIDTGHRWGPAFRGMHIYTGFSSSAAYSAGAFPKAFAEDILGVGTSPMTIVKAWFAASTATNEGTAAAMGPIGAAGVTDEGDYYVGKGSMGPTILPADVTGWWYLHQ